MITLWGEGRGFRVAWLLCEMDLPFRLRSVDMLAGVENDPEFLAINPAGFIPALQDGDVVMVESIAIMEYLMARYGPTPLVPDGEIGDHLGHFYVWPLSLVLSHLCRPPCSAVSAPISVT